MALSVVARGREVRLAVFGHGPGEPVAALDWWARSCLVFTEYGTWTVRARNGGGEVSPAVLVCGQGGAEYECGHPYGVDDRSLCLLFPAGVTGPPAALLPVTGRVARLRRDLRRQLSSAARPPGAGADPDGPGDRDGPDDPNDPDGPDGLDAIAWTLLAAAGSPDAPAAAGARDRERARRLRMLLDREFADPALDTVAAGALLGLSRTRMIHVFRDVVGTTPHRYLVERRVAHAAQLLAAGDVPVTDICFDSGFGSVARFQAAFRRAWGLTPSQYRARCRAAG
jgi:AraC-like DNA-binding protein